MVFGSVRDCHAEGTEVIWDPAHPHQETVEGRAVRTGEEGFFYRYLRGLVLQNYVIREGGHCPGDCVGVEGADGFFVGVGGDYAILHEGF